LQVELSRMAVVVRKALLGTRLVTNWALTIVGAALFCGWVGVAEASPWGLDQRPENLSCVAPDRPPPTAGITSQRVFENLSFTDLKPVSMSQPPGDPSRWIVAGRLGKIISFTNDNAVTTTQLVLDITDRMQFTDTINHAGDSQQFGITSLNSDPEGCANTQRGLTTTSRLSADDG